MTHTVPVTKEQAEAVASAVHAMEQARQVLEARVSLLALGHITTGTEFAGVDVDAAVLRFTVPDAA